MALQSWASAGGKNRHLLPWKLGLRTKIFWKRWNQQLSFE